MQRPGFMKRAVIDIGTNSVKLLVAEVDGQTVVPLWEESEQTRLGRGFYPDHRLQSAAIAHTAATVARLSMKAREAKVSGIRAIATSAVRDAVNQEELLGAVLNASGLSIEVISGEKEGDWAYAGVRTEPALADVALLILDVGGGSTEFILGSGNHQLLTRSFALGTVRSHEQFPVSDPPTAEEWTRCRHGLLETIGNKVLPVFKPYLQDFAPSSIRLVGTGGTTAILALMELGFAKFDRALIEGVTLSKERVWHFQKLLWSLSLADRRKLPGLPSDRADVILFGAAVFALVMSTFEFDSLRVSTRGIRFAALMNWT